MRIKYQVYAFGEYVGLLSKREVVELTHFDSKTIDKYSDRGKEYKGYMLQRLNMGIIDLMEDWDDTRQEILRKMRINA